MVSVINKWPGSHTDSKLEAILRNFSFFFGSKAFLVCWEVCSSIDQIVNEALVALGFDYDSGMKTLHLNLTLIRRTGIGL